MNISSNEEEKGKIDLFNMNDHSESQNFNNPDFQNKEEARLKLFNEDIGAQIERELEDSKKNNEIIEK